MYLVGRLDIKIYGCVSNGITTDEVIITDERISHIRERHPGEYEKYFRYLKAVIEDPDYIIEANKPETAIVLKEIIEQDGTRFKAVVKLNTSRGNEQYKNSVITFMKIRSKEWKRLLRNKQILYSKPGNWYNRNKKEDISEVEDSVPVHTPMA